MFSRRLDWDLRPNPLSELVRAKRASGAALYDLTESNPTRAGLRYPAAQISGAFASRRSLRYEPSPEGLLAAREAVAGYYRARGQDVDPSRILLTTATSEAYAYLFKLLADPGDEILAPRPSYPLFEFLAALESVRVVQYPLVYHDGWQLDFETLRAAVTPRTRAVVVVNPNNPTGSYLKRDELEELVALCRSRDLAIISDEVFSDYCLEADERRVAWLAGVWDALTFCLSGLSKTAGLPQMKLGWIVVGGPESAAARRNLELIADTYLSVATPVQHALPLLLAAGDRVRKQIATRVRGNLAALAAAIPAVSGMRVLRVEGGWNAIVQVPRTRTEEEWALELLGKHDVLVQPGFFYDFATEAFLVLSLLTPPRTFTEGVRRLLSMAA